MFSAWRFPVNTTDRNLGRGTRQNRNDATIKMLCVINVASAVSSGNLFGDCGPFGGSPERDLLRVLPARSIRAAGAADRQSGQMRWPLRAWLLQVMAERWGSIFMGEKVNDLSNLLGNMYRIFSVLTPEILLKYIQGYLLWSLLTFDQQVTQYFVQKFRNTMLKIFSYIFLDGILNDNFGVHFRN